MRRAVFCLLVLFAGLATAEARNPTVTVLDFETESLSRTEMRTVISLLSSALFQTHRYTVIDVTQRDILLREMEFAASDCADSGCQLRIGQLLSADSIVTGSLAKIGSRYVITAKMLETGTGATIGTADGIYPGLDAMIDAVGSIAASLGRRAGEEKAATERAALSATTEARGARPPLRIGVLAPLTGGLAAFGVSAREGAQLAVEQWNARGGVTGRPVEAVYADGRCAADAAEAAAIGLIREEKVRYLVGEVCSPASIAVARIAQEAGVLQISPTSTNAALTVDPQTALTRPLVFRACFIDPFQGVAGAAFAYSELGARSAFVMYDPDSSYVHDLASAFETEFRRLGGRIVGRSTYAADTKDFAGILAEASAARPDVLYLPDYFNLVNLVLRQARAFGIAAPFLGGDGWESPELDLAAAEGCYFTAHGSAANPLAEAASFARAYGERFRDEAGRPKAPDSVATLGFEAMDLLLQAIEGAGTDDPPSVARHLESSVFRTVSGYLSLDAGHNPRKGALIEAIRSGRVVLQSVVHP